MFSIFLAHGYSRALAALVLGCMLVAPRTVDARPLTLADVLALSASADPTLAASDARIAASDASIRQAQIRPRPSIGVDIEDFAGTGPYSAVDATQTTTWYERVWERGSKRQARIAAAESERGVTVQRGRLRTLDLLEKVQSAWAEAVAAEAAVSVAEEQLALARRTQGEVSRRVSAAVDPLFAGERANGSVTQARIARDQAQFVAANARATLASWWSGSADFTLEPGDLATASQPLPSGRTPDLALIAAERDAAKARIRLEESKGAPDPTLRAGVRHFSDNNDVALMVGGSIPLGTRSANRANVERARAEQTAAEADLAVARIEQDRAIARLEASRSTTSSEIAWIDREILPNARRVVEMVRAGYNRGGFAFTYLELSQAQQAVIDARMRRIDLLRRFHLEGARLDRLTGRHLSLITAAAETRP